MKHPLAAEDILLNQALDENILQLRALLLERNLPREVRSEAFSVLTDCKNLQNSLTPEIPTSEDTADFDIREFKK